MESDQNLDPEIWSRIRRCCDLVSNMQNVFKSIDSRMMGLERSALNLLHGSVYKIQTTLSNMDETTSITHEIINVLNTFDTYVGPLSKEPSLEMIDQYISSIRNVKTAKERLNALGLGCCGSILREMEVLHQRGLNSLKSVFEATIKSMDKDLDIDGMIALNEDFESSIDSRICHDLRIVGVEIESSFGSGQALSIYIDSRKTLISEMMRKSEQQVIEHVSDEYNVGTHPLIKYGRFLGIGIARERELARKCLNDDQCDIVLESIVEHILGTFQRLSEYVLTKYGFYALNGNAVVILADIFTNIREMAEQWISREPSMKRVLHIGSQFRKGAETLLTRALDTLKSSRSVPSLPSSATTIDISINLARFLLQTEPHVELLDSISEKYRFEKYIRDLVDLYVENIIAKSKLYRRSGQGDLFVANNVKYVWKHVESVEMYSETVKKLREIEDVHLEACVHSWLEICEILKSKPQKKSVRNAFKTFCSELDELVYVLRSFRIDDDELRHVAGDRLKRGVMSKYAEFMNRNAEYFEGEKIRYTAKDIEDFLTGNFQKADR